MGYLALDEEVDPANGEREVAHGFGEASAHVFFLLCAAVEEPAEHREQAQVDEHGDDLALAVHAADSRLEEEFLPEHRRQDVESGAEERPPGESSSRFFLHQGGTVGGLQVDRANAEDGPAEEGG